MGNLHLHFSVQMKCVTELFYEESWRVYLFLVIDNLLQKWIRYALLMYSENGKLQVMIAHISFSEES